MPSTYTSRNGIEKPGQGEQEDTWGVTANLNYDMIDQSLDGVTTETLATAGTSGSPNTISVLDGALSAGRNRYITFNDGGDLGADAFVQLTPNDVEKIMIVTNSLSGGRSIFFFQGTYSAANDFELSSGSTSIITFDGAGAGAVVSEITSLYQQNSVDIGGGEIDNTVIGGNTPAAGTFTDLTSDNVDIGGGEIDATPIGANSASTGAFSSLTATTADIDGGTVDGTTIGATTPSTGAFTTITGSGDVAIDTNTLFVDVSTDRVGVNNATPTETMDVVGTLAVSGDAKFDTDTLYVNSGTGFVGIGTISPATAFHINRSSPNIRHDDTDASGYVQLQQVSEVYTIDVDPTAADANSIFQISVDGTQQVQVNENGAIGVNDGAGSVDFGTSGQVLTSGGSASEPTWETVNGGRTWQDVQASRSKGVVYTNDTGHEIFLFVRATGGNGANISVEINGTLTITDAGAGGGVATSFARLSLPIPPGDTYEVTGNNISQWFELR